MIRRGCGGLGAGEKRCLTELEGVIKRSPSQAKNRRDRDFGARVISHKGEHEPIVEQWEATHGSQPGYRANERQPISEKAVQEFVPISYASTRSSIDNHANAFRELVENLPGEPRISFVGHSLGNIVFRRAIGEWQNAGDPRGVLSRMHRAVMCGPPNQGSAFAASLSKLGVFETLTGASGMHLGPALEKLQSSWETPPCPFAIVIGDISNFLSK